MHDKSNQLYLTLYDPIDCSLEKEMANHSSVLAQRIPGTGEPGGLPPMGSHRVGHDWSDLAATADCSLPGSSIHGILQARILEWVTIPFSRGSSQAWVQICVFCGLCTAGRIFTAELLGKPTYLLVDSRQRICPLASFEKLILSEKLDHKKSALLNFHSFAKQFIQ